MQACMRAAWQTWRVESDDMLTAVVMSASHAETLQALTHKDAATRASDHTQPSQVALHITNLVSHTSNS